MTRTPIHPGLILKDELKEINLSSAQLAKFLGIPANRITQIIKEKRAITADTALRLGQFFNNTAEFWLNLQKSYELKLAIKQHQKEVAKIPSFASLNFAVV